MNVSTLNNMSRDVWEMIIENLDMRADDVREDPSSTSPGHPAHAAPRETQQKASRSSTLEPPEHAASSTME